jgi:hypothetical protein
VRGAYLIHDGLDNPSFRENVRLLWCCELYSRGRNEIKGFHKSPDHKVSMVLTREITSFENIPMDDTVGEGPHAIANAISVRARRSGWPWIASTMRLDQNLQDVSDLVPATDADLGVQWDLYKSVVQPPGRKSIRPKRMTRKKFERSVYHLAECCGRAAAQPASAEDERLDDFDGAEPVSMDDGSVPDPLGTVVPNPAELLIKEFVISSMQPYTYYSVPVVEDSGTIIPPLLQNLPPTGHSPSHQ